MISLSRLKEMVEEEIENKINPNDWLEPYKPIPACEIKDCNELIYCGDGILGCRIAEDGLVCDDFNNDDECCMYRQLEYYKEALKAKEQECEAYKMEADEGKEINAELKAELTRANCQIADDEILQCDMREAIEELKAENDELKETFDGLLKVQYQLADSCKKLRQCLTEIKEIAESEIDSKEFMAIQCMLNGSVDNKNKVLKQILQKISECEANQ